MKSLIYDTETTGFPDYAKPSADPCQPRVTQICAELVDDDTREVYASMRAIIQPEGWAIPDDVAKLTGITTEKAEKHGLPIGVVLPHFLVLWSRATHRVAHNETFDMRMIRIEMVRQAKLADSADAWKSAPAFCTCNSAKSIVNLPPTEKMRAKGMTTPKPPNLAEAYKFFTGLDLVGAHDAGVDVGACKAVYFGIRDLQRKAA